MTTQQAELLCLPGHHIENEARLTSVLMLSKNSCTPQYCSSASKLIVDIYLLVLYLGENLIVPLILGHIYSFKITYLNMFFLLGSK